jgi:hypothetical protein
MKFQHALWLLSIAVTSHSLCSVCAAATPPQITFVQPAPAGQNPGRQALPPDQKKTLPTIEPVLPGDREQGEQPDAPDSNKRAANRPRPSSSPSSRPSPSPTAAPSTTPTPAPSPTAASATPTQTPATAAVANRLQSPPPPSTSWQLPALGVLTLLVFGALVFVLFKLRNLLREGSSE